MHCVVFDLMYELISFDPLPCHLAFSQIFSIFKYIYSPESLCQSYESDLFRQTSRSSVIEEIGSNRCFDGSWKRFKHQSEEASCSMTFSVYLPPRASSLNKRPVRMHLEIFQILRTLNLV